MNTQTSSLPAKNGQDWGRFVVIIPAFNEARFIGSVVLQSLKYSDTVIVVDDGSTDDTDEVAAAAGAIVIKHEQNRGKGAALNTAFKKARELNAPAAALLDGDGQHRPCDLVPIIRPIIDGEADMVIGSRYLELESDIPFHRRVGQRVVTAMTSTASGIYSTDSWSGYRAFSHKAIEKIYFREGGWGVDPEFQFLAQEHNLRVKEVPIVAIYEENAKRNPLPHGLKTVQAIMRLTGQHRPLLFFGLSGFIGLVLAALIMARLLNVYNQTQQMALGLALWFVLIAIVSTLTLYTGIILHSTKGLMLDIVRGIRY